MIEAALAVPGDWKGDLIGFLQQTLVRWMGSAAGGTAELFRVVVSSYPTELSNDDFHPDGWLFFTVSAEEHFAIELEKAVVALERIHPRLPSIVWGNLTSGLRKYFEIWDPIWAIQLEEGLDHPLFDPEAYWGEEVEASRMSAMADTPTSLQKKPLSTRRQREIVRGLNLDPATWEGKVLFGALRVSELARRSRVDPGHRATQKVYPEAFANCYPGEMPLVAAWVREGDSTMHVIDYDGDSIYQAGEALAPAICWPLRPCPQDVRDVFEKLEDVFRIVREALAVLELLADPPPVEYDPATTPARPKRRHRPAVEKVTEVQREQTLVEVFA